MPEVPAIDSLARANSLYSRLGAVGIDRPFLRKFVLPDWWEDEAACSKAGFLELATRISRRLGIRFEQILDEEAPLQFELVGPAKFKGAAQVDSPEKVVSICKQVAELAVYAMKNESLALQTKAPGEIREEILASGERWVGLRALASYCWKHGVPVLHITNFPQSIKKPDGMLMVFDGRPAIVICKNQKQPAWLLFILAHEIGHLVAGHGDDNGVIVDSKLVEGMNESSDDEEREADQNALEILTGNPGQTYNAGNPPNAARLAEAARHKGSEDHVCPGHVVLNYIHGLGPAFFPLGNAALAKLEPRPAGPRILRDCLASNLDWSQLPEENAEYLMRMAGIDAAAVR